MFSEVINSSMASMPPRQPRIASFPSASPGCPKAPLALHSSSIHVSLGSQMAGCSQMLTPSGPHPGPSAAASRLPPFNCSTHRMQSCFSNLHLLFCMPAKLFTRPLHLRGLSQPWPQGSSLTPAAQTPTAPSPCQVRLSHHLLLCFND